MPETPPVADPEDRFLSLARQVGEPLRRYVVRRTDPDTSEEVLADTMLVLWRRLDDVPADDPLPWCYAVARGCLANAQRSRARQRRLRVRLAATGGPHVVPPVDTDLPDPEVHAALGQMSDDDRELLRLWAWEDLSAAQIAASLGVTPNAVHVRLHRARRRLADVLGKRRTAAGQEQVEERRTR